jgi:hypothetical protein
MRYVGTNGAPFASAPQKAAHFVLKDRWSMLSAVPSVISFFNCKTLTKARFHGTCATAQQPAADQRNCKTSLVPCRQFCTLKGLDKASALRDQTAALPDVLLSLDDQVLMSLD